jgi:hypothetical protein
MHRSTTRPLSSSESQQVIHSTGKFRDRSLLRTPRFRDKSSATAPSITAGRLTDVRSHCITSESSAHPSRQFETTLDSEQQALSTTYILVETDSNGLNFYIFLPRKRAPTQRTYAMKREQCLSLDLSDRRFLYSLRMYIRLLDGNLPRRCIGIQAA